MVHKLLDTSTTSDMTNVTVRGDTSIRLRICMKASAARSNSIANIIDPKIHSAASAGIAKP